MPKCEREGYAEEPFFYLDEEGDAPFAVAWLDLRKAVPELLRHWPDKLQMHVEVLDSEFENSEVEEFGDIERRKLMRLFEKHAEAAFDDGAVRFRIWRKETDKERCIGIDEHGVLYLWEETSLMRGWLRRLGAEERKAELIYEDQHSHLTPEDAETKREKFVRGLGLGEPARPPKSPKDPNRKPPKGGSGKKSRARPSY
jgi:hypothetical protein